MIDNGDFDNLSESEEGSSSPQDSDSRALPQRLAAFGTWLSKSLHSNCDIFSWLPESALIRLFWNLEPQRIFTPLEITSWQAAWFAEDVDDGNESGK